MRKLRRCAACGAYTLKVNCPKCRGETKTANPPKYSPEDKWAKYRRRFKFPEGKSRK